VAARGPAVIYALGGGLGHLSRALVLARAIDAVAILHRAPGDGLVPDIDVPPGVRLIAVDAGWTPADLRACLAGLAQQAPVLVVDTFPAGVAHELDDALLSVFGHRVLVRRYLRPGAYDDEAALAARFDTVLVPYREAACEWDGEIGAGAVHVGFLVRALAVDSVSASGPGALDLVILGDAGRLPPGWRALLPARTRCVSGRFRALPAARRYLGTGAGHNLTYELHEAGVCFAVMPCERRYDDQFRRADRLGAGVYTRDDFAGWLGGEAGRTGWLGGVPGRASVEERVR
jgi:hypothetical protein